MIIAHLHYSVNRYQNKFFKPIIFIFLHKITIISSVIFTTPALQNIIPGGKLLLIDLIYLMIDRLYLRNKLIVFV